MQTSQYTSHSEGILVLKEDWTEESKEILHSLNTNPDNGEKRLPTKEPTAQHKFSFLTQYWDKSFVPKKMYLG